MSGNFMVTECHQILAYEYQKDRVVFDPVKDKVIDIVFNEIYGTRFEVSPLIVLHFPTSIRYPLYKNEMCLFLRESLQIISVSGNTNDLGKFFRISFKLKGVSYNISDTQYIRDK